MYTASQLQDKINRYISALPLGQNPKGLYAPARYTLEGGGKRIRPVLLLMAYNLYQENPETMYAPAAAIEIYHNCTLLHDDVMDKADMRRGKPTVHKVWNNNTAILSGDAMLILACQYMTESPSQHLSQIVKLFNQTMLQICEGQQYDMDFEQRTHVTEHEYIEMIQLKTAVLLAAALKIGAIAGGAPPKDADLLYDFGINLGTAFQLQDDLLDVYGDPAVFGKNIGGDILCNKKTFLLIKAIEKAQGTPQATKLTHYLETPANTPEEKITAITNLYNQLDIKQISEAKIQEYYQQAIHSLNAVNVPPHQKQELKQLAQQLMHRTL